MKAPVRKIWLLLLVLLASGALFAATQATAPHVKVALVSERNAVVPGQETWIGLHFQLEPEWHIYWINPGDSGQAPKVEWKLPSGMVAGSLQWPAPERIPAPPLTDYGYSDEVLLMAPLHAEPGTRLASAEVAGAVRWLVCREVCIPGKASLDLQLPVAQSSAPTSWSELFAETRERLPKPPPGDWKIQAQAKGETFILKLETGSSESDVEFFPLVSSQIENAAPQNVSSTAKGAEVELKKSEQLLQTPPSLQGVVLLGGTAYLVDAPLQDGAAPAAPVAAQTGRAMSPLTLAAFALLGGMILNLMPCVFPVLSIKALGLMNASSSSRRELRMHGILYTAGVLCCFWLMLGVLFALRSAGREIGWGFQLQTPGFVAALAALLFLMGLSLAGVFEIGMSWMGLGGSLTSRSGYTGSFFTGVLATVVATPCTAPFMGTAVGFALAQSALSAFVVFTFLALGLALPYGLLCFVPQWARFLPKPGAWMETFKQAMAFPLFATVIWLLWVFGKQTGVDGATRLMAGLLIVAIASWLLGRIRRGRIALPVAIVLIIGGMWLPFTAARETPSATPAESGGLHWKPYSPERVKEIQAQGKPVFVDFTAAWCITCQVNERTVFGSAAVQKKLRESGAVLLKADWTSYDPVITKALASFGRSGVPFYVIYTKNPSEQPRPLPDLITPQIVIDALDRLN